MGESTVVFGVRIAFRKEVESKRLDLVRSLALKKPIHVASRSAQRSRRAHNHADSPCFLLVIIRMARNISNDIISKIRAGACKGR